MGKFESNAMAILEASLRKVTLIDDDAITPFEWDSTKAGFWLCKDLCSSFSKVNAVVDFIPYTNTFSLKPVLRSRTDLIILDWELASSGSKFEPALKIIQWITESECPHFVCVYTSAEVTSFPLILIQIKVFLAWYSYDPDHSKESFALWIDSKGGNSTEFFERLENTFNEFLLDIISPSEVGKQIFSELHANQKLQPKDVKEFIDTFDKRKMAFASKWYLPNSGTSHPINISIDIKNLCLIANDTIVLVQNKDELEPVNFVSGFTKAMSMIPHGFLTFLNLEYRNKLLENSAFLWKSLQKIDERAFFYHLDDEDIEEVSFLGSLWRYDVTSFIDGFKSSLIPEKGEYIALRGLTFENDNPMWDGLARLNCYYNLNSSLKWGAIGCQFADVFVITKEGVPSEKKYILCVSPHCDCLRPSKIGNRFLFVESTDVMPGNTQKSLDKLKGLDECNEGLDEKEALWKWKIIEDSEKGHISFIMEGEDVVLVQWKTNAPFSIHIPDDLNTGIASGSKKVFIDGAVWDLNYCSTLKENYAQRMANHALSYANRIGITFAKPVNSKEIESKWCWVPVPVESLPIKLDKSE